MTEFLGNIKRMLKLALQTDSKLTVGYYGTAILGGILPIVAGLTSKFLIDHVILAQHQAASVPLIITLLLAAHYIVTSTAALATFTFNQTYFDYLLRYKLQNGFSILFARKLTELDVGHLEDPKAQNLITTTRDTYLWRPPDFLRMLSYALAGLFGYMAAFVGLLQFGAVFPILLTIAIIPRTILRLRQGSIQWSIYGSGAPEARKLWYLGYILSNPAALREIKVFRSGKVLIDKYHTIQEHLYALNKKPIDRYIKMSLVGPLFEYVAMVGVVWLKLPAVLNGSISVGSLAFLLTLVGTLITSAASFGSTIGEVYEDNLYVNDFLKLLALPKLVPQKADPVLLTTDGPPKIEFKKVSFTYPNGTKILDNISFTVEPGQNVALVGMNGAGKSTIIKLLCRFYDVSDGQILVNGHDLRDLSLDQWYSYIGTLFQDFVSYHFSVKENILLGDSSKFDEAKMMEAAKRADAASFIERLPQKYSQILGREFDDGEELSGGQWQKLAIARAFYHASPVLIMDEPTSAIDAEAEFEIFENLEKEYRDKTLILVSHRFSTVRNADVILVIDGGQIIERGSHEKLLKLDGRYSSMFKKQAKGYE